MLDRKFIQIWNASRDDRDGSLESRIEWFIFINQPVPQPSKYLVN